MAGILGSVVERLRVWIGYVCLPAGMAALVYGMLTRELVEAAVGLVLFGLSARELAGG